MNYLAAIIFMIANGVAASEVSKMIKGGARGKPENLFLPLCILLMLLIAEFVILANGFSRLMSM